MGNLVFFSNTTKEEANASKGFTNQADVLSHVHPEKGEKGICAQLANLYTKYEIGGKSNSPDFLKGTPQEIYNAALKERRHQEDLFKQGEDGLHSAFVDTKTPYFSSTDTVKVSDLNSENLAALVNQAGPNHIVTYPVKQARANHTIAFGKSKHGESCYSFSANFPPREHPCNAFKELAKEIKELGDQDKTAIIATHYMKR
ncbi:hypothetical protein LEAN103870_00515 [Legionella anisa]|uniref:Type IV secretion protein Dot n=1 Tax=Legionella anisa TaxID=28082 RepID=A0AAX0WVR5_9GAMM|nr:hypothetical protein [Legionella anisa]AWN73933.1 hypothetical protein DLD14_08840 [Legionella anisa]KTC67201.1 hypothetical protein Lani_3546 [Legionella anisa]MBN5936639.1 hypothetical protein [Legionella anisa]MCW8426054.1 hypothetical protein [Legionella anisa]MCW8448509.1 hypothetical protein [Legionella anisa]